MTEMASDSVSDQTDKSLDNAKRKSIKDIKSELAREQSNPNSAGYSPEIVRSIMNRVEWDRTVAKLSIIIALGLAVVILAETIAIVYLATREPVVKVAAKDPVSNTYRYMDVGAPSNVTAQDAYNYGQDLVLRLNTYSFSNWFVALKDLERHFITPRAYLDYQRTLEGSALLSKIKENYLTASIVITEMKLKSEARNQKAGGAKEYTFTLRFRRTLAGGGKVPESSYLEAAILVREVPLWESFDRFKVVSYVERQL